MEIEIREITVPDSAAITRLSAQLGYETTLETTVNLVTEITGREEDVALAAVTSGKVIGWIHAFRAVRLESGYFVEIGGLVVDEQHRGLGIGKMLLTRVKQWSSARQIKVIKVRCNTRRLASHRFYLNAGFTEVKEQKVFELKC